jgi:hypothetical protein
MAHRRSLGFARDDKKERVVARKGRLLNRGIFQNQFGQVWLSRPFGTEFGNGVLTHAWCECYVACMKPCPSFISANRKLVAIPTGADQRKRPDLCSAKRSLRQSTGYPPIWTARHSTPYPLGSHRYVQGATYGIGYTPMFCLATIQGARRIRDAGISWVIKKLRRVDSDV